MTASIQLQAKKLAQEYQALIRKPLGITSEVTPDKVERIVV